MELAPDISVWQTGEGGSNQVDVESAAGTFPGMFVRFTDYSLYPRYGADAYYVDTVQRAIAVGGHASGYLYPRPAMSDPVTQVDNWFNSSPAINMAPMLDPEGPGMGGMSGGTLTQWIDEALARMAQLWPQWLPVFYSSRAFMNGYGLSRPSTPHLLMLAEYHWGYQPFTWDAVSTWTQHALSAYGGPDMPDGYDRSELAVWQFSSSAQAPGFPGNIDMSMVWDWAVPLLFGGGVSEVEVATPQYHIRQFQTPDGTVWLAAGLMRTALSDEGLRQSLLDTGQLDPNLMQINPWTENALFEVTPDAFVKLQGTVETAVGNVVAPVVSSIVHGELAAWRPPTGTGSGTVTPSPFNPASLTNAQLADLLSSLSAEMSRRLISTKLGSADTAPEPSSVAQGAAHPLAARPVSVPPPTPAVRMQAPPEGPSKMTGSTYHNAPIDPPADPEPEPPASS